MPFSVVPGAMVLLMGYVSYPSVVNGVDPSALKNAFEDVKVTMAADARPVAPPRRAATASSAAADNDSFLMRFPPELRRPGVASLPRADQTKPSPREPTSLVRRTVGAQGPRLGGWKGARIGEAIPRPRPRG